MAGQPRIEQREATAYLAIPATVTMSSLAQAVDRGFPELFGWLSAHHLAPAGAPFIRYLTIDMDAEMTMEIAVPVGDPVRADGHVHRWYRPTPPCRAGHASEGCAGRWMANRRGSDGSSGI